MGNQKFRENRRVNLHVAGHTNRERLTYILLMDVQMPVMNGYEATKAIRKSSHEQAKTIPIIAMTANAFSDDIHHSLTVGMNAHISKPVEMKVLEKTISSIKFGGLKRRLLNNKDEI